MNNFVAKWPLLMKSAWFSRLRIKSSLVFDPRVWQTNLPYFQLKEFHPVEVDLPYCNWYIISLSLSVLKFITYYSHVFAYSVFSAINTLYTMKLLCHILIFCWLFCFWPLIFQRFLCLHNRIKIDANLLSCFSMSWSFLFLMFCL